MRKRRYPRHICMLSATSAVTDTSISTTSAVSPCGRGAEGAARALAPLARHGWVGGVGRGGARFVAARPPPTGSRHSTPRSDAHLALQAHAPLLRSGGGPAVGRPRLGPTQHRRPLPPPPAPPRAAGPFGSAGRPCPAARRWARGTAAAPAAAPAAPAAPAAAAAREPPRRAPPAAARPPAAQTGRPRRRGAADGLAGAPRRAASVALRASARQPAGARARREAALYTDSPNMGRDQQDGPTGGRPGLEKRDLRVLASNLRWGLAARVRMVIWSVLLPFAPETAPSHPGDSSRSWAWAPRPPAQRGRLAPSNRSIRSDHVSIKMHAPAAGEVVGPCPRRSSP
jgi:hypothetical protein